MNFNLRTLRLFISACEENSIAKAAEREGIAASALSKRLSDFEATTNVVLFKRTHKGLEPTAAALTMLHLARAVMRDLAQLEAEVSEHRAGIKGTVRIHSNVWAILQYLPEDLASFLACHPLVRLQVEESTTPESIKAVRENICDIGIIGSNVPAPALRIVPYYKDRLVAVVPRDHVLTQRAEVKLADMLPFHLIGSKQGSSLDEIVQRAIAELNATPALRLRVTGFETVCRMVESRLGVGFVPLSCAARYVAAMNIATIRLDESWAERGLSLCFAQEDELTPAARVLVKHLSARASQEPS
ncbi:LysR family transcriptional regulator [Bosea sp. (in: a-proteobacteria)]|uniref:LysR family transcriptional regulator n=1 Tax=Bosea sp. (in: a-proteobacteria) TaxID=1871050 RepID=UPI002631D188|nr:LysR family transcriptional regulator [Bosea sp. (in: a-proteobacteria)]MCO5091849.1 LysR family transcriptional regulator [Bosea sp. (in: a-proteobacteria)]